MDKMGILGTRRECRKLAELEEEDGAGSDSAVREIEQMALEEKRLSA